MAMQQLTTSAAECRVESLNRSSWNVFSMMTSNSSTDSGTSTPARVRIPVSAVAPAAGVRDVPEGLWNFCQRASGFLFPRLHLLASYHRTAALRRVEKRRRPPPTSSSRASTPPRRWCRPNRTGQAADSASRWWLCKRAAPAAASPAARRASRTWTRSACEAPPSPATASDSGADALRASCG